MRTLFVGAGATGGYFGGRLFEAGKDVTFLVREARAAALAERGLRIHTRAGDTVQLRVPTQTAATLDRAYDLVVLAVKGYALEGALADMAPAVGDQTVIVPFLNGMRHLDALTDAFGTGRVYGGVCMVATQLDANGDVVQLSGLQQLGYGPTDGIATERLAEVADALSGAGFASLPSLTILQDMWEKWVFLASLGAITCLMRGTIGEVNAAPGGTAFASGVADEAIAIATAAGFPPRPDAVGRLRTTITEAGAPTTSSLYRDLSAGAPVEGRELLGDLVDHAARSGIPAPLLTLAFANVSVYDARRLLT